MPIATTAKKYLGVLNYGNDTLYRMHQDKPSNLASLNLDFSIAALISKWDGALKKGVVHLFRERPSRRAGLSFRTNVRNLNIRTPSPYGKTSTNYGENLQKPHL